MLFQDRSQIWLLWYQKFMLTWEGTLNLYLDTLPMLPNWVGYMNCGIRWMPARLLLAWEAVILCAGGVRSYTVWPQWACATLWVWLCFMERRQWHLFWKIWLYNQHQKLAKEQLMCDWRMAWCGHCWGMLYPAEELVGWLWKPIVLFGHWPYLHIPLEQLGQHFVIGLQGQFRGGWLHSLQ